MKICAHKLRVSDLERSLAFYREALGMALLRRGEGERGAWARLGYHPGQASLELRQSAEPLMVAVQPNPAEGYWKLGLAVDSVDRAVLGLRRLGIAAGDPFEVPEVARLSHLCDPDGYCIELVQRTLEPLAVTATGQGLAEEAPSLLLSTVRVKDPGLSLAFYRQVLGMRLLSRQRVEERNMTLYFLGYDDTPLPVEDIDAVANREWLWQRRCTLLELQHIHGTESLPGFRYHNGPERGFDGLAICGPSVQQLKPELAQWGVRWETGGRWVDPDGFPWSLES